MVEVIVEGFVDAVAAELAIEVLNFVVEVGVFFLDGDHLVEAGFVAAFGFGEELEHGNEVGGVARESDFEVGVDRIRKEFGCLVENAVDALGLNGDGGAVDNVKVALDGREFVEADFFDFGEEAVADLCEQFGFGAVVAEVHVGCFVSFAAGDAGWQNNFGRARLEARL